MKPSRSKVICLAAALVVLNPILAAAKPLKVFILAGQSNMQGKASEATLAGLAMDPATKPLYDKLVDAEGKTRVHETIRIAAFSNTDSWGKIGEDVEKVGPLTVGYGDNTKDPARLGPELAFGVTMVENLKEPILIIKTSWGGKSLMVDFRPPSAGNLPDTANEKAKEGAGKYYNKMMERVKMVLADPGKYYPGYDAKQGYEIAGFGWFQGFNDLVGPYPPVDPENKKKGGAKDYSEYSRLLACFIRDVRKDLSAPAMPFAIGVLGVGGKNANENNLLFRKAMAAPAAMDEFKGTVKAVNTANFWDEKLGEMETRKNATTGKGKAKQLDPEGKYAALREKVAPLQKELDALGEQKGKDRDKAKIAELQQRIEDILYTPEEKEYIAKNRSSQGYHYMGSAKTYSRVGEALALAIVEMRAKAK